MSKALETPKLRTLRCMRCTNEWDEPLRSGARPWYCPTCEPKLAARRRIERARKRGQLLAPPDPKIVSETIPQWMQSVVVESINYAHAYDDPNVTDLTRLVRELDGAMKQGSVPTREALIKLAGCSLAWAAGLPSLSDAEERRAS